MQRLEALRWKFDRILDLSTPKQVITPPEISIALYSFQRTFIYSILSQPFCDVCNANIPIFTLPLQGNVDSEMLSGSRHTISDSLEHEKVLQQHWRNRRAVRKEPRGEIPLKWLTVKETLLLLCGMGPPCKMRVISVVP